MLSYEDDEDDEEEEEEDSDIFGESDRDDDDDTKVGFLLFQSKNMVISRRKNHLWFVFMSHSEYRPVILCWWAGSPNQRWSS